jgi:hypothetical protein
VLERTAVGPDVDEFVAKELRQSRARGGRAVWRRAGNAPTRALLAPTTSHGPNRRPRQLVLL